MCWELQSNTGISKLATSPNHPAIFVKWVEITFEFFLAFLQYVPVYWVLRRATIWLLVLMIKLRVFCEIL